jgi:hypothetical protein
MVAYVEHLDNKDAVSIIPHIFWRTLRGPGVLLGVLLSRGGVEGSESEGRYMITKQHA